MITKQSTVGMTVEEWRASRRDAIGGSDAATLLGLNPYGSPYALWAEKTGAMIPEDISGKEAVRLGNDLEDYVAHRWAEHEGKRVHRVNAILRNTDYPFAHANIDRAVVGELDAGLECKTTSNWRIAEMLRGGEIPPQWYCQMTHYMMVTGAKRWYLAALVFGEALYCKTIERDEAEIAALASAEAEFWGHVQSGTPPTVDGSEATIAALNRIYPESRPGSVDLAGIGAQLRLRAALDDQIKALKSQRDAADAAIMQEMGEAERGEDGPFKVVWKSGTRRTFDREAFEKRFGAIPDEYFKVTETRSFRFSVKKIKEEK